MAPSPRDFAEAGHHNGCLREEEECTQRLNMLLLGLPPRALRRRCHMSHSQCLVRQRVHADTVIIFDWDDTLLCTSALSSCEPAQLSKLEQIAKATLELATDLGTTLIVTNANDGWVQQSASIHMPCLLPILKRVPVVSAREVHEHIFPEEPLAWKRETFWKLLRRKCHGQLNLIVLGDSFAEIHAADAVSKIFGHVPLVKTVKFKAAPSPSELFSELRLISRELVKLVEENRSISKALVQDRSHRAAESCRWILRDVRPHCSRPELSRPRKFSTSGARSRD